MDETKSKKDPGVVPLPGEERPGARDSAVFEEHAESPAQDHAERKHKEQGGGLLDGHHGVEVAVGQDANDPEADDHEEEAGGAMHHDGFAMQRKA